MMFAPALTVRLRRFALISFFSIYLYLAALRSVSAEDHLSVKWQDYAEDGDRIRVISKYLGFEKQINANFTIKGHGVHDSITGASPTGSPSKDGETVPLGNLTDVRDGGAVDLIWNREIHSTTFQYAYSDEHDYQSRGYSLSHTTEINKRNTGLSAGLSYIDDEIQPEFFDSPRPKDSYDYFVGISQVLDPNTIVALNFTYGDIDGYISDPYKLILKTTEILPGLSLPLTFDENRPNERQRSIWFLNLKRHFEGMRASLDFGYRYFDDDWGVESHTFDIEWYQKIGEKLILRPSFRYYRQSEAEFYLLTLDGTDIVPFDNPQGLAPHYSSDYRLSRMDSYTYGLKAVYKLTENLSIDADYERYEMKGKDGETLQFAYPDADIVTIGATIWF